MTAWWRLPAVWLAGVGALVGAGLWWQATHGEWNSHLVVDPVVYWQRASFFFAQGGLWSGLGTNEYQPGALWFFVLIGAISGGAGEFHEFLRFFMAANLVLLAGHFFLAARCGSPGAGWRMILFAALTGPILLYRFELLVSLLVLVAWWWWRSGRENPAAFLLGVATATKVYPVLLFPLLLGTAWARRGGRGAVAAALAWAAGGFVVVGLLGLWGATWQDVVGSLRFHFQKPFGIEGVLGSAIPVVQGILGVPLRMTPGHGIYGFTPDLGAAFAWGAGWLWLLPWLGVTVLLLRARRLELVSAAGTLFVLFGWYVAAGKLMAPQYTWWAVPLLALVPSGWFSRREWTALLVLIGGSLVLGQVVYPVNYSAFLASFNDAPLASVWFWLNALKNLLWLAAVIVASRTLWGHARASR